MNLLRRFFSRKKQETSKPVRIVTDADGLRVFRGDEADPSELLRWEDVTLVGAYRKDCYGYDLCCVELLSKGGGAVLIQQQDEGFVEACIAITQSLTVSNPDWFLALQCRQAFDTSIEIIYQRPVSAEGEPKQASF